MKRYIEIVYDNSGSMNGTVGGKKKYEIAQELFEKEILPTIAMKGDVVNLRLLSSHCHQLCSRSFNLTDMYGVDRKSMLTHIKSINHDQSTPLIYTISDAVDACRNIKADQYLIFVLTDGDDTCGIKINDLINQDVINDFVKYYNVLLVQFAVDSKISRNNLSAFASYLGGQSILLDSDDSTVLMRTKLKKALKTSGFSSKLPLDHCFESQPGFVKPWDEIEKMGYDFHQALLLYNKGWLSWMPEIDEQVTALELSEFQFLFGLYFKTGIPDSMMNTMLAQLKKPYYYSHDCIHWDFSAARWKYFKPQVEISQIDNPEAQNEDGLGDMKNNVNLHNDTYYLDDNVYRVEYGNTVNLSFTLKSLGKSDWNKELKIGDQIIFKRR